MQATFEEVRDKAYKRIRELYEESFERYGVKLMPTIDFSIKGRSCCGKASYRDNKIKLNAEIAQRNFEDFEDTLVHEYCHLLDYKLYKGWGHGATWKRLMIDLGGNPVSKAKGLDVEGIQRTRKVKRYTYDCSCQTYPLSASIHNKIKTGTIYHCKRCHTQLKFKGTATLT